MTSMKTLARFLPALALAVTLWQSPARAQTSNIYCLTGTGSTGFPIWLPDSATNPCPVTGSLGPSGVTGTNLSGTITTGGTFQSLQVATAGRKGCTVQNNGTHNMEVFFGPIGSATTSNSVVLSAGQSVYCAVGGVSVLTDQVSITGTTADPFFANFQ